MNTEELAAEVIAIIDKGIAINSQNLEKPPSKRPPMKHRVAAAEIAARRDVKKRVLNLVEGIGGQS